jgi:hypothetical protein
MAEVDLPGHVVTRRRDGRREVLLHRSMAVIGDEKLEIKSARGALLFPAVMLVLVALAATWLVVTMGTLPLWWMVVLLLFCVIVAPVSVMGIVGAVVGADVVVDRRKGSITWQQGYLGMGVGTKELVPFAKIDYLEVGVEGDQPDRWRGEADALRQFSLVLVKRNGKRLTLANVPAPVSGQLDGMDRTLAVANAVAALAGTTVRIPEGWELVEVDAETGSVPAEVVVEAKPRGVKRRVRKGRRY